jgi:hypothetical protein
MSEQRAKPPNAMLLNLLYDRVISDFASRRWEALVNHSDPQLVEELENALRLFWCDYIDHVVGVFRRTVNER